MADLTLCRGTGCPQRDNCRRYTAVIDTLWQSFFTAPPWDGMTCLRYWPLDIDYVLTNNPK